MPLIQALHGLTKSTKNNAMPRVYPYGVVFNTNTQSNLIHLIGVHNETVFHFQQFARCVKLSA